jgi:hypothetical protein
VGQAPLRGAFVSKLTDCDGDNSEAHTCWDFALSCGFISAREHKEMTELNQEVGKMLGSMIAKPQKFLLTPDSWLLIPDSGFFDQENCLKQEPRKGLEY